MSITSEPTKTSPTNNPAEMGLTNQAPAMLKIGRPGIQEYLLEVKYNDCTKTAYMYPSIPGPFASIGAPTEHKLVLMYSTVEHFATATYCMGTIGGGIIDITIFRDDGAEVAKVSGAITGGPDESRSILERLDWVEINRRTTGMWGL
jgi:hypothetical protein